MESEKVNSNKCGINVKLIPVKIVYFLLLGALATLMPYLPVFMGVLKLTPIQMSIIFSIATAFSAPTRLMLGYLADRLQKRSMVFAICCVLTMIFHVSLYFTPVDESLSVEFNDVDTHGKLCSKSNVLTLKVFNESMILLNDHIKSGNNFDTTGMKCCHGEGATNYSKCLDMSYLQTGNDQFLVVDNLSFIEQVFPSMNYQSNDSSICIDFHSCKKVKVAQNENVDNLKTFWIFFVLFFLAQVFFSPLQNILDSLIYSFLRKTGKPEDFGKSRLWGTIGFGLCAFLSGIIQDALSARGWEGRETYVITFIIFSVGLLLATGMTLWIRDSPQNETNEKFKKDEFQFIESEGKPFKEDLPANDDSILKNKKELIKIMCGFQLIIIIMTAMISGILAGCLEGFFYYFLASLDPNNKSVMGVCLAVACICEVIVLFFSGKIASLIGSKKCLYVVFVVFVIRFVASSYIENPWYGIATEASQCICFGLLYPILASWASSLVPPQLQSTVQCYLGSIYFSLGRAVGAGIAGVVYEKMGPRVMFQVFASISGGYLVVLVFIFEVLERIRSKNDVKVKDNNVKVIAIDAGSKMSMEGENQTMTRL